MFRDKALLLLVALLLTGVIVATAVFINTQRLLADTPAFAFRPNAEEIERLVCPGEELNIRFDVIAFEAPLQILATSSWYDIATDKEVVATTSRFYNMPRTGTRAFQTLVTIPPHLSPGRYERIIVGSIAFSRIDTHTLIVEVGGADYCGE